MVLHCQRSGASVSTLDRPRGRVDSGPKEAAGAGAEASVKPTPRPYRREWGRKAPHPPSPSCASNLPNPTGNQETRGRLGLNAASSHTRSLGKKTPRKRRKGESCRQGQPPRWGGDRTGFWGRGRPGFLTAARLPSSFHSCCLPEEIPQVILKQRRKS